MDALIVCVIVCVLQCLTFLNCKVQSFIVYLNHRKQYNIQNQKPTVFFKHKPTIAEHVPVIIVSFVGDPAICSFHFFAALYLNPFSLSLFSHFRENASLQRPQKIFKNLPKSGTCSASMGSAIGS